MTLIKWSRGNEANRNGSSQNYHSIPLISSDFDSVLPGLFNTFSKPFFGNEFVQEFFDDTAKLGINMIGKTLPAVNISETESELIIEVAAPGMNKKDFKVELVDNHLHIGYTKESKNEEKENNHLRREFSYESFERNFKLPKSMENEKVEASYTDGILKISIPKKEEAKKTVKAVEIK